MEIFQPSRPFLCFLPLHAFTFPTLTDPTSTSHYHLGPSRIGFHASRTTLRASWETTTTTPWALTLDATFLGLLAWAFTTSQIQRSRNVDIDVANDNSDMVKAILEVMVSRDEAWEDVEGLLGPEILLGTIRRQLEDNTDLQWVREVDASVMNSHFIGEILDRVDLRMGEKQTLSTSKYATWLKRISTAMASEFGEQDDEEMVMVDRFLSLSERETTEDKQMIEKVSGDLTRLVNVLVETAGENAGMDASKIAVNILFSMEVIVERIGREARRVIRDRVTRSLSQSMATELDGLVDCIIEIRKEKREDPLVISELEGIRESLPDVMDTILQTDEDFQRTLDLSWKDPAVARGILNGGASGLSQVKEELVEILQAGDMDSLDLLDSKKMYRLLSSATECSSPIFPPSLSVQPEKDKLPALAMASQSKDSLSQKMSVEERVMLEIFGEASHITRSGTDENGTGEDIYLSGLFSLLRIKVANLWASIKGKASSAAKILENLVKASAARSVLRRFLTLFQSSKEKGTR